MKILADENIAQVADYFGWAGDLVTLPGRAITAAALRDVDALLVRSVTRVDAALLAGSPCRFVGTATSGIDHIDVDWLASRDIGFSHALGCNANAVVEYVFSALAQLSTQHAFDWRSRSYGIVGCGEVGRRLAQKLLALGIRVAIHDPFLDAAQPLSDYFAPLVEVLAQEVVTFHTPLTRDGPNPTWHMLDRRALAMLAPSTIVLNAARGAVVDNLALLELLRGSSGHLVVLDAWEGEPAVNLELLRRIAIGTPHIAGYSREGKLNGTRMIAAGFCGHFGLQAPSPPLAEHCGVTWLSPVPAATALEQLNQLILQARDIRKDHAAMQALLAAPEPAVLFDRLRSDYPPRSEFAAFSARADELVAGVADQARILGFRLDG
jgi:erythronate-4-phosphate dehydrogenase